MTTTLLLDADIIAYELAATHQRTYRWPGQERPSVSADPFETLPERIDEAVHKLIHQLKADAVVVCLSCPTEENWRLDVLPSYKGNRDYSNRPAHLQAVKDYLEREWPSYRRPRLEADDIMGILSTHPSLVKGKKIIVSEDKDMQTIPGWLFNPRKDRQPRLIDPEEADWWHLYQTLVGDTADGYTGLPGCGPKGAEKLLGGPQSRSYIHLHEAWPRIVGAYEAKGLTEGDALVQARVARICRTTDYDFKAKEVRLWSPRTTSTA